MAENGNAADTAATDAPAKPQPGQIKMQVLGQYIRDMSFENIVAQKGVSGDVNPDVRVQVNLDAKKRPADHQYEVMTRFKVTSRNKDSDAVLFALELDYGGLFHVEGVPEEQLHPFLMIECPRMLFPYVRRIVSDVTRDGGFPPLNLENVDFLGIYRTEMQRRAEAAEQKKGEAADGD